jgi:[protein-PII] uridylyltransferase
VGKGMAIENHVAGSVQAVEGIVGRLGLNPADAEAVRFLVANHLEMSRTLSRDLFDPQTIRNFAEKVGSPARLKMLCLMTYADVGSVNPEALTPWRAALLWQLYAATANYFSRSVDDQRLTIEPPACNEAQHAATHYSAVPHELSAFLVGMPKRYLWSHSQPEMEAHFDMARGLATRAVQLRVAKQQHSYLLTVVTADRPFLFATIAGMLAAWGMNIVKAEAFCNRAHIVLDTFHFTDLFRAFDLNLSEVERFKHSLVDVISGKASLDAFLEGRLRNGAIRRVKVTVPTQVSFDNACSSHSTLLELIAQDRPGLLYQVASTLSRLRCNIEVALVETEGQKAIDVFYVTSNGGKLDQSQQHELCQALLLELGVQS